MSEEKIIQKLVRESGLNESRLYDILSNERDWRIFILQEISSIKTKQGEMSKDLAGLMVKSGVWGLLGGGIPVLITLAIYVLKTEGVLK